MVGCPKNILHTPSSDVRNDTGNYIDLLDHSTAELHDKVVHNDQCRLESWAMHNGRDMGL